MMMNDATKPAHDEATGSFMVNLLTGWGVPGSLARILAGAIIGALSALWALSQTGCVAEADASFWHGRAQFLLSQEALPFAK